MPTLNNTKDETIKILKWLAIVVGIIILFWMMVKFLFFIKDLFTPPPPPSASFGKLSPIVFPNQIKENLIYSIGTLTGYLPSFSDRAKVYKIIIDPPTLLGLEKTREKVSKIGFTTSGAQISEDTYQWINQDAIQKIMTINIFSSNFTLSSSYLLSKNLANFLGTDEVESTVDTTKTFLSELSLLPTDINETKTKTTLYSIAEGSLVPTSKISNAEIVRVDFFQKDIDKLPIYYEKGIFSTLDFLVGKENGNLEVLSANFLHRKISDSTSTYAIKTAAQAYSELQNGKAYIANKDSNTVEFTIKNVFLAYYIGETDQDYLMPVIVFEGSNNFIAYVSAVKDEWISN